MKSLATYQHREAKINILAVLPVNNSHDKRYYREIVDFKKSLAEAEKKGNKLDIQLFRAAIKERRGYLKLPRLQRYTFKVYVNKYRKDCQVDFVWDKSQVVIKEMIKQVIDLAKKQIRLYLKLLAVPRSIGKKYTTVAYGNSDKGYVFVEEGSILKFHVQKNMKLLLDGKTPTMPRRYVGIELEFCAPIREEQFALKLFQKGIHKFAQLKHDGSLRPQSDLKEVGFELAILLEESNYKKGLKKITDLLTLIKAVAKDRRCGLHVHLDMRRRNKDMVYNNLVACQFALLSMVDPNRYNNEFCRVVNGRKFPTEFTGDRQERYKTINAAAYYKYRTLEVRMHEGSVDFKEISNWVDLLLKVANYQKKLKDDVTKLSILRNRLKLKDNLYNYALERSCGFQIQNNPRAANMREDIAALRRPRFRIPPEAAVPEPPMPFRNRAQEVFQAAERQVIFGGDAVAAPHVVFNEALDLQDQLVHDGDEE